MASKAERERAIAAAAELVRSGRLFVQRATAAVTEDDTQDSPRDYSVTQKIIDFDRLKVTRFKHGLYRYTVSVEAFGKAFNIIVKDQR